jgi:CRISPR-associated exonuclease Cas4
MKPLFTATHIAYYFVCHRKLWLFAHGVQCETDSDAVRMGKHIHETSYAQEKKELDIDGTIVLDWFDAKRGVVHEVKKSPSMETAHEWQVLYYVYYLKHKGLRTAEHEQDEGIKGELNYPTLRMKKMVILTPDKEHELCEQILPDIERIIAQDDIPTTQTWKVCKTCSYCDLCYS